MKTGDWIAIGYVVLYAAAVFFFPLDFVQRRLVWKLDISGSFSELAGLKGFGRVVNHWPYLSGFFKVALLATFGEMLKMRGRTGSWKTPQLFPKFIVWGLYGVLFSFVFALFAKGVGALSGTALWFGPADFNYGTAPWSERILMGFSISLWCNLIFCYPMMLSHEWCNSCIAKKRFLGGAEFFASLNSGIWGSFMLKTILFFWIPAHTVTFSLPPDYRVLMSAVLSLALGFILTVKK